MREKNRQILEQKEYGGEINMKNTKEGFNKLVTVMKTKDNNGDSLKEFGLFEPQTMARTTFAPIKKTKSDEITMEFTCHIFSSEFQRIIYHVNSWFNKIKKWVGL